MQHLETTRSYEAGHGGGEDVFPIFRREAIYNPDRSAAAGVAKFDTIDMVEIIIPGDPGNRPHRRVKEEDKVRWPQHWQRFEQEQQFAVEGFPIDEWTSLRAGQVHELKAMGFYTVESVANCSDAHISKLGLGGMTLRDRARARIEAMKRGSESEALVQLNARLREERDQMMQTIEALRHQVESMAASMGENVASIPDVSNALSHARETIKNKSRLPSGWREFSVRDMIALADTIDEIAVKPRNKSEAISVLSEYEAGFEALK